MRHIPEKEPKRTLGQISAFQQAEELRSLRALGTSAAEAGGAARAVSAGTGALIGSAGPASSEKAVEPPTEPVDKLAAWLLQQADLSSLEPDA